MNLEGLKYVAVDAECLRDVKAPYSFKESQYLGNAVTCSVDQDRNYKDWVGDSSMSAFLNYILSFDLIIGYNTIGFDYPLWGGSLLLPEHPNARKIFGVATEGKTIDLAKDFKEHFKSYIKMVNVTVPTLGDEKEMEGGFAPFHWRNGKCMEVIEYCRGDVRRTIEMFEVAARGEELSLLTKSGDIKKFTCEPKIR